MSWEAFGAIALFLVVVFFFGRLWFVLMEGLLNRIKRIFSRRR